MIIITPKHGRGQLNVLQKGETANPNGQPRKPKGLKEFIKAMENEDDEIIMPANQVEFFTKNGEDLVKFKNFKAGKLFASLLQHSMKGNMKALDILIKMGFAGGYEPVKQQIEQTNITAKELIDELEDADT